MSQPIASDNSLVPSLPAIKILIVEDDQMMQLGLEQALSKYPQLEIVEQVDDGYLGVQAALKHQPDLIIMDIGLPRLDGIAAAKKIREKLPTVKIVILTSHTIQTEVIAALAAGADAYCVKGSKVERLINAIAVVQDGATYLDPQIAKLVVENLKPATPKHHSGDLSEREMEVLELIVEGKSNPQIAKALHLSPNTIKTHVRSIMNKLTVNDRVQAAVVALRSGLI
ncbi:MAG: response regulator transcription factor [Waterburya sp.]